MSFVKAYPRRNRTRYLFCAVTNRSFITPYLCLRRWRGVSCCVPCTARITFAVSSIAAGARPATVNTGVYTPEVCALLFRAKTYFLRTFLERYVKCVCRKKTALRHPSSYRIDIESKDASYFRAIGLRRIQLPVFGAYLPASVFTLQTRFFFFLDNFRRSLVHGRHQAQPLLHGGTCRKDTRHRTHDEVVEHHTVAIKSPFSERGRHACVIARGTHRNRPVWICRESYCENVDHERFVSVGKSVFILFFLPPPPHHRTERDLNQMKVEKYRPEVISNPHGVKTI